MRQLALDIAKISDGGQIFPQSDSMLKKLSQCLDMGNSVGKWATTGFF